MDLRKRQDWCQIPLLGLGGQVMYLRLDNFTLTMTKIPIKGIPFRSQRVWPWTYGCFQHNGTPQTRKQISALQFEAPGFTRFLCGAIRFLPSGECFAGEARVAAFSGAGSGNKPSLHQDGPDVRLGYIFSGGEFCSPPLVSVRKGSELACFQ